MKSTMLLLAAMFAFCNIAHADDVKYYKDGPVSEVTYVKTKLGHFDDYVKFLDLKYKKEMEAYKKAGLILSYNVFGASPRKPSDPDLILVVTYPNMATLDKSEQFESISKQVSGSTGQQNKETIDRNEWRDILGSELVRELILK
ncbi:hypothetical protein [Undibacterium terreum]|uniref:DUF1330 domain-containing protein n=1 Tax=Undibacterium terreum TaxID=1224302 RepID=A0A916XDI1_9BURK|nr:hypothetical protein [Undibacterium terreum]GGC62623.1 hypothetical protein GCM10011396_06970 [Undibacterium terreum]